MKTKTSSHFFKCLILAAATTTGASHAAFFFPSIDVSVDGATTQTFLSSAGDASFGTGNSFTGTFDANEVAGGTDLIDFSFTAIGGDITVSLTDGGNSSGSGFFRFNIVADASVTQIDYTFDYQQAILGSSNATTVLVGARANTTEDDAVLTMSAQDSTDSVDLSLASATWRTANITGENPDVRMNAPSSLTDSDTTANLGITASDNFPRGLGLANTGDLNQLFGNISGSLTADDGNINTTDDTLGAGSVLAISLNGDFQNVPEPTSTALLGLGLLGFVLRRHRK